MHYFSGKGCFEFLESMHYCIGILNEQKENFVVNGRHYYWMSISDMERDPNIVKKNLDVIDFVKELMHA